MAWEFINTLWGPEVLNLAPKCDEEGCDTFADNAGYGKYHKKCSTHHKLKYKMGGSIYRQHRKDFCENIDGRLGYKCGCPIHNVAWQLTVDHIDGDKKNHAIENLQTLCWNCHRYKTMLNEENLPMNKRRNILEKQLSEVGVIS